MADERNGAAAAIGGAPPGDGAGAARTRGRREADRAVTALLAALPHEFRRSLGVIALLADSVGDGAAIVDETRRLDRLIDAVGEVARMSDGRARVAVEPLRADEAIAGALRAFAADPDACPVTALPASGLPPFAGNAELVERVLLNLLANASRHGAPPVVIEAVARRGRMELTVSDGGSGVPAGAANGGAATPPAGGGMGMGLIICRLFAEGMGGSLVVGPSSAGGRVTLRLPEAGA
jgi:two-component system sensor histidine kinase KdpD